MVVDLLETRTKRRIGGKVNDAGGTQDGWDRVRVPPQLAFQVTISLSTEDPSGGLQSLPGWRLWEGRANSHESHTLSSSLAFPVASAGILSPSVVPDETSSLRDTWPGKLSDSFDIFLFCTSKSNLSPARSLLKSIVNNSIHYFQFFPTLLPLLWSSLVSPSMGLRSRS